MRIFLVCQALILLLSHSTCLRVEIWELVLRPVLQGVDLLAQYVSVVEIHSIFFVLATLVILVSCGILNKWLYRTH
jgi:hypothetical protein